MASERVGQSTRPQSTRPPRRSRSSRPPVTGALACLLVGFLISMVACGGPQATIVESRLLNPDELGSSAGPDGQPPDEESPGEESSDEEPSGEPEQSEDDVMLGPSDDQVTQASAGVAELTLEEKAGQVIMAGFSGTQAPLDLVEGHHLGGVIAMEENVTSTDQVLQMTEGLQEQAAESGREWPLLIGTDQEGGEVARLDALLTPFPSFMTYGAAGRPELAEDAAADSGAELAALGFTTVFAPVADVTSGTDDPTIGSRSAGSDPATVSRVVNAAVQGYVAGGVVPVVKHFPGHGSVPADSHTELPVQQASVDALRDRDLVPFARASDAGAPAIMTAHIEVTDIDPGTPATLSSAVLDGLLRAELGFDGLVVTDALNMAGITDGYGVGDAAVQALAAGSDLLLMPADVGAAQDAIVDAVNTDELPEQRLTEAATRVVAVALYQQAQRADGQPPSEESTVGASSVAASLAATSVVSGPCGRHEYIGDQVQLVGGSPTDRERFTAAADRYGVEVGSAGPVVRLLAPGDPGGSGDVVVALGTPYALGDSTADTARLALYGRTPAAFRALLAILSGERAATGELPVPVEGVQRAGCPD